ncbi:CmpA/NrtA family ABC transporter substrate-binding protein [Moraxella nasicaprae]|uniref:ABC transporter substrate-binding protein n=1 Tax=Moraxella nasicaprae TaxID=2904122 RepID=A0ABY6F1T0_9GAMM|nr:CmpA/NrtA family ABC transporter substrate-binding protein [Moraxella nasicaprae]UXZ04045.1 ABC transporter substrate-binding protein [Moraxella nasicaprae]
MTNIFRPFDTDSSLGCRCGRHHSQQACDMATPDTRFGDASQIEQASTDFVEAAAIKALFPHEPTRRAFLASVGKSTAMAAIGSILPLGLLQEAAAMDKLAPEKKDLTIGFIPIICSTPLIMADPLGYYAEQGINAKLVKRAGWALVRDQVMSRQLDASHFLAPMPLAMTLGLGSAKQDTQVACIQNINGQALVMALKHKDNRNPANWRGMTFAIPFEHSMHNYLLRYFLAEHGLDPDKDVKLRLTTPPDMIANLRAGNIDGFFGPEPFNQRAVWDKAGYIHTLSRDIWNGHPCCSFGTSAAFIRQNPNSFLAMYRAILKANVMANNPEMKKQFSKILSPANYLNQPELVIRQSLTGRFADGIGKVQDVPDRTGFDAMPWHSLAIWMMTQMKRWGYLKGNVNYQTLANQVFMLTDAKKQMANMGYTFANEKSITVMGKRFDPSRPDDYLNSFKIKR